MPALLAAYRQAMASARQQHGRQAAASIGRQLPTYISKRQAWQHGTAGRQDHRHSRRFFSFDSPCVNIGGTPLLYVCQSRFSGNFGRFLKVGSSMRASEGLRADREMPELAGTLFGVTTVCIQLRNLIRAVSWDSEVEAWEQSPATGRFSRLASRSCEVVIPGGCSSVLTYRVVVVTRP